MKTLFAVFAFALLAATMVAAPLPSAADEISSVVRGGLLYDKWYKVKGVDAPKMGQPSYPKDNKYYGKKGEDWRCKNCHGWDYMGKDGAYKKGSHATGIAGIRGAAGADVAKVGAILKDATHAYGDKLSAKDLADLALFVSKGQVDMDRYIDRAAKKAKGDAGKGAKYYNTLCANCHGFDGKKVEDMDPVGKLVGKNPWEIMHKLLNGQPAENMPSLRALDMQVTVDILAYSATLPKK